MQLCVFFIVQEQLLMQELLNRQTAFIHGTNSSGGLGGSLSSLVSSSSVGGGASVSGGGCGVLNPHGMQTVIDPFMVQRVVNPSTSIDHHNHVRQSSGDSGLGK